jgi:hypothetical protein
MYEYKFTNSPLLISALNRIGPAGLFDFLLPDVKDYISSFGEAHVVAVRGIFIGATSPLYGEDLQSKDLYDSIYTVWRGVSKQAAGRVDPEEEVSLRCFGYMANHVWMMDNQAEEAVRQIDEEEFDVEALRSKHLSALMQDPAYVADQFLKRLVRGQGFGKRLADLVRISIGRIALKETRRDIDWCRRQNGAQINHIADWLASAVATEAAWLSNVDDQGRQKKLMKFGSLEAMHAEAEKHMRKALAAEAVAIASEEETFADEGGEYRIVRLKTIRALDYESNAMRHCIGHGAYDRFLGRDDFLLLSLRDKGNRPHLTIQVNRGKIVQFSGKANSEPKPDYRKVALDLLSPLGIAFPVTTPLDNPCREIEMPQIIPPPYQEFGGYPT